MNDDENRKRGHQDDYEAAFSSKRAALGTSSGGTTTPSLYSSESEAHLFKLLCPQSITGLIIGRKGAIINQLNQSTGAKIRLSQNNEFFPGTTDRILLINGSKDCIANALNELVSRIADAPEKKTTPSVDAYGNPVPPVNRGPQGAYQVRVLIPKIASAAIIGRKGAVIQRMGEQSNCKFQLGEENDPYGTRERILSISSPVVENLVLGTQTLMAELLADPRIRTYPNTTTNYSGSVSGHSPGSTPVLSSVGMSNQGGFKSQPAPMPYSNMNNNMSNMNSNGPPPLLQTSYGPPPTGYGMQIPPPNQYMMQMQMPPGYNPQMPPQVMMTHHMQHPGIPQPQMYSMVPNQQFSINPNGAMMPPPTMYAPGPVGGYSPMQQQDGNHQYQVQQQYQVQANMPAMPNMPNMTNMPAMMMPAHMYASHGHMNMKK